MSWKIYFFPPTSCHTYPVEHFYYDYFGIDLINKDKERTLWTHKPSVWEKVLNDGKGAPTANEAGIISPPYVSCPVRAIPNGPNETKTFKSGKGVPIQQWILLVPMSSNAIASQSIKCFLSDF